MNQDFISILIHPKHKTPLTFNIEKNELIDLNSNDRFQVSGSIPILLISDLQKNLTETDNNFLAGSTFSYKDHYQKDAEVYDYQNEKAHPVEETEINFLRNNILIQIPQEAKIVLDIGCGGAWLAKNLLPKGKTVISTDISSVNPIKALKKYPNQNHWGLVADVYDLPIKPNSVDCIVASEIIEHVADPKIFIGCLLDVLKPGGSLIITTPYNELIRTSLCIHCNQETPHNAHLHSFTEKKFVQFLPPKIASLNIKLLNSKLLVKTHIQYWLRFLPLTLLNIIDKTFISLTAKKAFRMMVIVKK